MQKEATPMFDRIENATIRVISLGAGVQSSVMSLMAARGELEMPDAAIFADTQWEPKEVYDHLNWLEEQLPFPVYRVTHGDIRKMSLDTVEEAVYRPSINWMGITQWREMRDNDPDGWNDLVDFDHSLRDGKRHAFGMKFPTYIHASHQPMDEVDLSTEQDHGQLDMFGEECEGMCGI